jgi:hypothetical protein
VNEERLWRLGWPDGGRESIVLLRCEETSIGLFFDSFIITGLTNSMLSIEPALMRESVLHPETSKDASSVLIEETEV